MSVDRLGERRCGLVHVVVRRTSRAVRTRLEVDSSSMAEAGSATILDFGYQLPDCMWPPIERRPASSDFAELGERRFVRGLLPVLLASGEEFRYGVWLEVSSATFDEVVACWDDVARYPTLRFAATIANAAPPWGAMLLGAAVDAGTREPNARPFVLGAREPWLQEVLARGWSDAEYAAVVDSLSGGRR